MRMVTPSPDRIRTRVSSPVLFAWNVNPPTGKKYSLPRALSWLHSVPSMHSAGSTPELPPTQPQLLV